MRLIFNQKVGCVFVLLVVLLGSVGLIYRFVSDPAIVAQQQANLTLPTATLPALRPLNAQTTATPAPQMCSAKSRSFEMGVAFPQWSSDGYGGGDTEWLTELPEMHTQTASCWVSMQVLFSQDSLTSTVVTTGVSTPSIASLTYGIRFAHAEGLHVFLTPLLDVQGPQSWAGSIQFPTLSQEQAWFTSYWLALKPYVLAAAQAGAEQLAIGTEEEWLQQNAPDSLWDGLIANIHSIFPGTLTYNMNWTSLPKAPPDWMRNPDLKMIGVSAYLPQATSQERLLEPQISNLWQTTALPELDAFSVQLGEPIFISETGYRDSADALYQPWVATSNAPADPQEQAYAISAALDNLAPDTHILGVFFWAWDEGNDFNLKGSQAAQSIREHYQAWQV